MAGDFGAVLRPGTIVIIDAVEYVVEDVGQIAADQTPKSRRHGKVRRFVPVVYLKTRVVSELPGTDAGPVCGGGRRAQPG